MRYICMNVCVCVSWDVSANRSIENGSAKNFRCGYKHFTLLYSEYWIYRRWFERVRENSQMTLQLGST